MRYLFIFMLTNQAFGFCKIEEEGVKCKSKPCVGIISDPIGAGAMVTCQKVYIKNNDKWKFDHYSLINSVLTTGKKPKAIGYESKVYDIE